MDPINVVFYGNATADRAINHIRNHTGWTDESGDPQYFSSHGWCSAMYGQRASGDASRTHIRVRKTYGDDNYWGTTAVGDAHHEDVPYPRICHAVDAGGVSQGIPSGFDRGREEIWNAMSGSHYSGYTSNWGNTREFYQCDEDYAGGDGYQRWIYIHNDYH